MLHEFRQSAGFDSHLSGLLSSFLNVYLKFFTISLSYISVHLGYSFIKEGRMLNVIRYNFQRCQFHRRGDRQRPRGLCLRPLQGRKNPQRHLGRLLPDEPLRLDAGTGRGVHAREAAAHLAALEAVGRAQNFPRQQELSSNSDGVPSSFEPLPTEVKYSYFFHIFISKY